VAVKLFCLSGAALVTAKIKIVYLCPPLQCVKVQCGNVNNNNNDIINYINFITTMVVYYVNHDYKLQRQTRYHISYLVGSRYLASKNVILGLNIEAARLTLMLTLLDWNKL